MIPASQNTTNQTQAQNATAPRTRPLIMPPQPKSEDPQTEIGIIKGLSFKDRIQEIAFELQGWERNPIKEGEWENTGHRIMNDKGIKNFVQSLRSISEQIFTMSYYDLPQISPFVEWYVRTNVAHFLVHSEDFGLAEENYNVIENYIMTVSFGAMHKARGAGDRNVVRGVYSEDALAKIYSGAGGPSEQEKKKGFFSRMFGK